MTFQHVVTVSLDDPNHRRRLREIVNQLITLINAMGFESDDTNNHIRTPAGRVLLFDLDTTPGPYIGLNGTVAAFYLRDGTAADPSLTFDNSPAMGLFRIADNQLGVTAAGVTRARIDNTDVAGNTALMLYDVDNGKLERVTVGPADSGEAGFKVLRIPNS